MMPDLDLDRRLAELAAAAGQTTKLDPAADVRRRADRRRWRRQAGTVALGLLVTGGLVGGIALGRPGRPGPSPVPAAPPAVEQASLAPDQPSPAPALASPALASVGPTDEPWKHPSPGEPIKAPPPYSAAVENGPMYGATASPPQQGQIVPPPDLPTAGTRDPSDQGTVGG